VVYKLLLFMRLNNYDVRILLGIQQSMTIRQ